MGLRRLTAFALAHTAGTILLLASLRDLGAEALSGEAGAALLLVAGGAAVLAGMRIALSVHLVLAWRVCRACGLAAVPLRAAALRVAPRAIRSIVAAAVGGSLSVIALTSPSLAASSSPAWPLTPGPAVERTHDPAWPLSEEADAGADASDDASADDVDEGEFHIVSSGENLWQIVAADLPGAATPQVAERIDEVHAANRATIGADADLLLPGQRLVLP
ncbi:hypothetical protein [Brevibacterium jeotgali]|uniref:LysM domain-containing protein n=1 Tax=Brevibacterium jeotgali TaxID=1262550 RepID=A0A2H1L7N1_9MICO|nr:hypothetical protein [Brevibacterium jeotgali]TWC03551.1 hypothetical protein FB108_2282 [Brevibacterium jeotgali]SMY12373.1 hypothetical protein BJEO58_01967 [Brevibacterium jeotgali]